jgi:hypothetical protein
MDFMPRIYRDTSDLQKEQADVVSRAAAQHAAFQSGTSWQNYLQKYRHFAASGESRQ